MFVFVVWRKKGEGLQARDTVLLVKYILGASHYGAAFEARETGGLDNIDGWMRKGNYVDISQKIGHKWTVTPTVHPSSWHKDEVGC